MIVSLPRIISPSTFKVLLSKKLIEEGIRGITHGDWVKGIEHVLSVERVKILPKLKEIAAEEGHEPVVTDLASLLQL